MLNFLSFSSGSSGNSYFLQYTADNAPLGRNGEKVKSEALLIDVGVSLANVKRELLRYNIDLGIVSAILITHAHFDHTGHVGSFCKRVSIPLCTSPLVYKDLLSHRFSPTNLAKYGKRLLETQVNEIGSFRVKYMVVPHDALQTLAYSIEVPGHKFLLLTDLGNVTEEVLDCARNSNTVVIESNYDTDMLLKGAYPDDLKRRISKGNGHLSNAQCAEAIKKFYHEGLKNIFLCHLSGNNNTPDLALSSAKKALDDMGLREDVVRLLALPRGSASAYFNL